MGHSTGSPQPPEANHSPTYEELSPQDQEWVRTHGATILHGIRRADRPRTEEELEEAQRRMRVLVNEYTTHESLLDEYDLVEELVDLVTILLHQLRHEIEHTLPREQVAVLDRWRATFERHTRTEATDG